MSADAVLANDKRFPGNVTLCYTQFSSPSLEEPIDPATVIEFKQIEFLDLTGALIVGHHAYGIRL